MAFKWFSGDGGWWQEESDRYNFLVDVIILVKLLLADDADIIIKACVSKVLSLSSWFFILLCVQKFVLDA